MIIVGIIFLLPINIRKIVVNKLLLSLLVSASALGLTACGGGGGSGSSSSASTPVTNVSAAGAWQGIANPTGYTLDLIVMPSGKLYTIFGTVISGGALTVIGADFGSASTIGNALSGSFTEYFYNNQVYTGTITGTVVANTSISGSSVYNNGNKGTFALTPLSASTYNFNTPAVLSNITGSWSGTLLNGVATSVTVSSAGIMTGSGGGCSFAGTIAPDPSGVNVFATTITNGVGCTTPGLVQTGISISYVTNTGTHQFITMVNSANTGNVFMAQR